MRDNIKIGDIIKFGGYDWCVLDVQDSKALILSDKILEQRPYHNGVLGVMWEQCIIRKYLNYEFFNKFKQNDKNRIAETQLNNPNNLWYGTEGGDDTFDKIFLLSIEEADQYFGNSGDYKHKIRKSYKDDKWLVDEAGYGVANIYDKDRIATYNGTASWWWLRSLGSLSGTAARVGSGGGIFVDGYGVSASGGGIRPALWLNL